MDEGKKKKKRIVMIIAGALLLVAAIIIFFIWRSKITATTMRILRLEGEVTLEDNGSPKQVKENLRLKSGNALTTALESLVSIGLDDTKIVTLNEKSRAEFNQSGRKLDLELTAGSLFFEVSAPLTDEETFDIRTSTMVVGIRGTSGLVSVEGSHESLIISDGTVHVIGTNPFTKEVKEIDVHAGQRITVYLYNDRDVDSIEFFLEDITEHDLPEFMLRYLRENLKLLDKVVKETGWDKEWILGLKKDEPNNDDNGPDDDGGGSTPPTTNGPTPPIDDDTVNIVLEDNTSETVVKGPTPESLERAKKAIIAEDPESRLVALSVGTMFDPEWYASAYPDVARVYGTDTVALVAHYLDYGRKEGRLPLPPKVAKATPEPSFDPNANSGGGSSDEEEEEEPEPSPTAKATGGGGTSGTWDSITGDVLVNGVNIGHTMAGSSPLALAVNNNTTLALPLSLTDNTTATPTTGSIDTVKQLAISDSGDTFTVSGGGHTVNVDRTATTPVYELDGTNYLNAAALVAAINAL